MRKLITGKERLAGIAHNDGVPENSDLKNEILAGFDDETLKGMRDDELKRFVLAMKAAFKLGEDAAIKKAAEEKATEEKATEAAEIAEAALNQSKVFPQGHTLNRGR